MSLNGTVVVGNLTSDPDLKFTESGRAYASFTVAVNEKYGEKERATFVDCTAWGRLGENLAASLAKGAAVIVSGSLRSFVATAFDESGSEKKIGRLSLDVRNGGPDLTFAEATVTKVSGNSGEPSAPARKAPAKAPAKVAQAAAADDDF